MAIITKVKQTKVNEMVVLNTPEAIGASSTIDFEGKSANIIMIFTGGSSASVITVKGADGVLGRAETGDTEFNLASGDTAVLTLESGRFKQLDETNRYKLVLEDTGDATVTVVEVL